MSYVKRRRGALPRNFPGKREVCRRGGRLPEIDARGARGRKDDFAVSGPGQRLEAIGARWILGNRRQMFCTRHPQRRGASEPHGGKDIAGAAGADAIPDNSSRRQWPEASRGYGHLVETRLRIDSALPKTHQRKERSTIEPDGTIQFPERWIGKFSLDSAVRRKQKDGRL